jgi:hypothetical protein
MQSLVKGARTQADSTCPSVAACISSKIHPPPPVNTTNVDRKYDGIQKLMKNQKVDKLGDCSLDDWKTMELAREDLKVGQIEVLIS